MKERLYKYDATNSDFRTALFLWQSDPESTVAVSRMDNLLKKAGEMGVNLTFKIKKEILQNTEARRSISEQDLRRYAKVEGDFLVFNMYAKKSPEGTVHLGVTDLLEGAEGRGIIDKYNFIFEAKSGDGWRTVGVFRAHEVDSFLVSKN